MQTVIIQKQRAKDLAFGFIRENINYKNSEIILHIQTMSGQFHGYSIQNNAQNSSTQTQSNIIRAIKPSIMLQNMNQQELPTTKPLTPTNDIVKKGKGRGGTGRRSREKKLKMMHNWRSDRITYLKMQIKNIIKIASNVTTNNQPKSKYKRIENDKKKQKKINPNYKMKTKKPLFNKNRNLNNKIKQISNKSFQKQTKIKIQNIRYYKNKKYNKDDIDVIIKHIEKGNKISKIRINKSIKLCDLHKKLNLEYCKMNLQCWEINNQLCHSSLTLQDLNISSNNILYYQKITHYKMGNKLRKLCNNKCFKINKNYKHKIYYYKLYSNTVYYKHISFYNQLYLNKLFCKHEIHVKTLSNKTIKLQIGFYETIENVKNKIEFFEAIPINQQKLLFHGKQLLDDQTLFDYNIHKNSQPYLMLCIIPTIQIFVKMIPTKTCPCNLITLDVAANETIQTIKIKIQNKTGMPIDKQRMIFAGKQLKKVGKLWDYNIKNDSTLLLGLQLKGSGRSRNNNKKQKTQKKNNLQLQLRGAIRKEQICWLFAICQLLNHVEWEKVFVDYSKNNNNLFSKIFKFIKNLSVFTRNPNTKPQPIKESIGYNIAYRVIKLFNTKQINEKWHIKTQQDANAFLVFFFDMIVNLTNKNEIPAVLKPSKKTTDQIR
ncbi:MAG: hypothetical protein GY739_21950, partial [Mesoflavibacter sp.]|nr:hypothetical protein [Mesoflavibacter sp.]